MSKEEIVIQGAKQHNLKNVNLEIPRDKLVVFTGLSGSGKSSLAFDTIYAEGQRRYVESLSAYARQFLGQMDKPDVEYIEGLSPAISIDQKTTSKNPRSTVGTVTEIYDYLRVLFARVGKPHCPRCGKRIKQQTVEQMVDAVLSMPEGARIQILSPLVRGRKGEYQKVFDEIRKDGYARVRVDGETKDLSEEIKLAKTKKHSIEVVVDRIVVKPEAEKRLADSIETALNLSEGLIIIDVVDGEEIILSQNFACVDCKISLEEITPRMFSFNNPYGACPQCNGLGVDMKVDPALVLTDRSQSIEEGAFAPWHRGSSTYYPQMLKAAAEHFSIDVDTPVNKLTEEEIELLLYGRKKEKIRFRYKNPFGRVRVYQTKFEGVIPNLERRYKEAQTDAAREEIESYMSSHACPDCKGKRLKKESLSVTINGINIADLTELPVGEIYQYFHSLALEDRDYMIARQLLKEIEERLQFLINVGLDYLTLNRSAGSLSGGESQRIRLATQIGSSLIGVLYILDEPSIGLHQRDNLRLIETLKKLRDLGNTLIVVEHDEETIRAADHIVDIGPGAGVHGGDIVASGSLNDIIKEKKSITGQYLCGKRMIPVPEKRRESNGSWLSIKGAAENNLKEINVDIPLGVFVCVTGVSGSGKSTLVNDIMHKFLASRLHKAKTKPGAFKDILGVENIDKVINIDQSPIGRTPRSNPATYTGVFDGIREVFSQTQEAKLRGYKPGRFSFNVKGGRCDACRGDGIIKIEMHFLPDVYVPCEVCKGKRYNRETLAVRFKGKTIADVLDMIVDEALDFFSNIPKIKRKLQTIQDVGLGYIRLGQPATTLSGGEAQRVKLSTELSKKSNGKTLYMLDEPTTGLHMADIQKLLDVLGRLSDAGDTVLVIEHNLDVIKTADHIIDLGPEGGDQGGEVIAFGTPEEIAENKNSYTGQYLRKMLHSSNEAAR